MMVGQWSVGPSVYLSVRPFVGPSILNDMKTFRWPKKRVGNGQTHVAFLQGCLSMNQNGGQVT